MAKRLSVTTHSRLSPLIAPLAPFRVPILTALLCAIAMLAFSVRDYTITNFRYYDTPVSPVVEEIRIPYFILMLCVLYVGSAWLFSATVRFRAPFSALGSAIRTVVFAYWSGVIIYSAWIGSLGTFGVIQIDYPNRVQMPIDALNWAWVGAFAGASIGAAAAIVAARGVPAALSALSLAMALALLSFTALVVGLSSSASAHATRGGFGYFDDSVILLPIITLLWALLILSHLSPYSTAILPRPAQASFSTSAYSASAGHLWLVLLSLVAVGSYVGTNRLLDLGALASARYLLAESYARVTIRGDAQFSAPPSKGSWVELARSPLLDLGMATYGVWVTETGDSNHVLAEVRVEENSGRSWRTATRVPMEAKCLKRSDEGGCVMLGLPEPWKPASQNELLMLERQALRLPHGELEGRVAFYRELEHAVAKRTAPVPGLGRGASVPLAMTMFTLLLTPILVALRSRIARIGADGKLGVEVPWLLLDGHTGLEKAGAVSELACIFAAPWVVSAYLATTMAAASATRLENGPWPAATGLGMALFGATAINAWLALSTVADLLAIRLWRKESGLA